MIDTLKLNAWRMKRFMEFALHSGTRYSIHSPFLFELVEKVIRGKMPEVLHPVETLRKDLIGSRETILKTDFGTGAGSGLKASYPVRTGRLARTSMTPKRRALRLYLLARHQTACNILEMGAALGLTTAYLALSRPDAQVVSLEGCPELSRISRENLDRLGIRNAAVLTGRFEDTLGGALDRLGRLDLLFMDGNHRQDAVLSYYNQCKPFLHNDSVVVIDDIYANPGMEDAWNQLCRREEVSISLDFFHAGWLFFRKESSKEHFRLRYL